MSNRSKCSDCAYNVVGDKYQHQSFVNILDESPGFKDKQHKCHCINTQIWTGIDEKNICIGRKEYLESQK